MKLGRPVTEETYKPLSMKRGGKFHWVTYMRHPFKEGFIDMWVGDAANNPNEGTKNDYSLGSFTSFYRLNGKGEWVNRKFFSQNPLEDPFEIKFKTAEEIWNKYFNQ